MANRAIFRSRLRHTDATNHHGTATYAFGPEHALAQFAMTGTFNDTFYASAANQLENVLELVDAVEPEFVAKLAIYARREGYMKDLPAYLVACLAQRDTALAGQVFHGVIDTGGMLRNFVLFMRSGTVGRRSLGTAPRRWVREWFDRRSDREVYRHAIGKNPSLADVIKLAHPRPSTASRRALYGFLIGRPYDVAALHEALPEIAALHAFTAQAPGFREVPDVAFMRLLGQEMSPYEWRTLARRMTWQQLRMNLNVLARNDAFASPETVAHVARKLSDPAEVRAANAFPYQLLAAYQNIAADVPVAVRDALRDAAEAALSNVPALAGGVIVAPDVSGSMSQSVTGYRRGATSRVRCVDVAGLVAAAFLRASDHTTVLPFDHDVRAFQPVYTESVLETANRLAAMCGGGTNISSPLRAANNAGLTHRLVVIVSDNETWNDRTRGGPSALMTEWERYRARVPNARLVLLDVVPNRTAPAYSRDDILLVGGFSDRVFDVISAFVEDTRGTWVEHIANTELSDLEEEP